MEGFAAFRGLAALSMAFRGLLLPSVAFCCLLLLAVAADAAFQDLGAGARAPGMGNAFTGLADDVYAIYYNPAGLAQLEGPEASVAYSALYVGLTDGSNLGVQQAAYAQPLGKGGRYGSGGFMYQRFGLDSLYDEQEIFFSYGKSVFKSETKGQLYLGLNAKYLDRSFSQDAQSATGCSGFQCGEGANTVLSGKSNATAPSADLSALYRFPDKKIQTGLDLQNVNSPNVAFSGTDKVSPSAHWGTTYKTTWMNIDGEIDEDPDPAGGYDTDAIAAAERYFPTLEFGTFGFRGSLGYGSRQWEQITLGLSYRLDKFQVDYGFMMPVSGIPGTSGTHRVDLTFNFGATTVEDQISRGLLRKAQDLLNPPPLKAKIGELEKNDMRDPHDLKDPALATVRAFVDAGLYLKAADAMDAYIQSQKQKTPPLDMSYTRLLRRLKVNADAYPEYTHPVEKWEVLLSSGLAHFAYGDDRHAILEDAYALSLTPEDETVGVYLKDVEKGTGLKAVMVSPDNPEGFLGELVRRAKIASVRGDYERARRILEDALYLDGNDPTALERMGSLDWAQGRYEDAALAWEKALRFEKRPGEIEAINTYLPLARSRLGKQGQPGLALPGQTAPRTSAGAAPKKAVADPRFVERLYNRAIEHYARGEYLQAEAMFLWILQIDPQNLPAQKALERIKLMNQHP